MSREAARSIVRFVTSSHYDAIGTGYAAVRRPDPRIAAAIARALDGCAAVVNVGAGAGSYEPRGPRVVAVEPSMEMARQRAPDSAPCVRAVAEALPFSDDTFDAALAVLTIHHWKDWRRGIAELRRVARRRIVILTWDTRCAPSFWMIAHYLPETVALDAPRFPAIDDLVAALPGAHVEPLPIPHDCADGFFCAYWRRPEAYLRPDVRNGISVLRQLPGNVVERAVDALRRDLESGAWHARFGALLSRDSMDLGYRLIAADP